MRLGLSCWCCCFADTYTLDNGVFLFLGFSTKDEQLLYPITRLLVRDVVDALRQLITPQTRHYFFDEHDPNDTTGLEKLKALNTVSTSCFLVTSSPQSCPKYMSSTKRQIRQHKCISLFTRFQSSQGMLPRVFWCFRGFLGIKYRVNSMLEFFIGTGFCGVFL